MYLKFAVLKKLKNNHGRLSYQLFLNNLGGPKMKK